MNDLIASIGLLLTGLISIFLLLDAFELIKWGDEDEEEDYIFDLNDVDDKSIEG